MTVEKQIKVTMEGLDIKTLSNMAECARRYLDAHQSNDFGLSEIRQLRDLITEVFNL